MKDQPKAQSRYRQVRLTVTQERGGRLTYRLLAKGLDQAWDEHTCIDQGQIEAPDVPITTSEQALRAVVAVISGQMLPPG